jgi:hypothetical protein
MGGCGSVAGRVSPVFEESQYCADYSQVNADALYCNASDCKPPVPSANGSFGAFLPTTIPKLFHRAIEVHGPNTAFLFQDEKKKWKKVSWDDYHADCMIAAKSMIALGLQPHDCVSVMGFNSYEW